MIDTPGSQDYIVSFKEIPRLFGLYMSISLVQYI